MQNISRSAVECFLFDAAEEYLLFTDPDIDRCHFIKSFRRYRGITPKRFRDTRRS